MKEEANLTPEQKAQKTLNEWTEKVNKTIEDSNTHINKLNPINEVLPNGQSVTESKIQALENTIDAINKQYYKTLSDKDNKISELQKEISSMHTPENYVNKKIAQHLRHYKSESDRLLKVVQEQRSAIEAFSNSHSNDREIHLTPEQKAQKTLNEWTEKVNKTIEDSNANVGKLDSIDDLNSYQAIPNLTGKLARTRQDLSYYKSETNRLLKVVQEQQSTIENIKNNRNDLKRVIIGELYRELEHLKRKAK